METVELKVLGAEAPQQFLLLPRGVDCEDARVPMTISGGVCTVARHLLSDADIGVLGKRAPGGFVRVMIDGEAAWHRLERMEVKGDMETVEIRINTEDVQVVGHAVDVIACHPGGPLAAPLEAAYRNGTTVALAGVRWRVVEKAPLTFSITAPGSIFVQHGDTGLMQYGLETEV